MENNVEEKIIKELIKKIIDNNDTIPERAKEGLKIIIETEHNPESILQQCMLYMLFYKQVDN